MAIQNDNTLVTKGDLKNLYSNKILPYLGGNFALATNVSDYYSTDEKLVGLWINGKPLYQKTIVDTLPSAINTPKYVNVGASIDYIMIINAMLINNDGFLIPLPSINPVTDSEQTRVAAADNTFPGNPNTIQLRTANSNHVGKTIYTTVQYTKTTDSAGSAVTTPGCYDINRPDLWPTNQEIFFGNGLYGYRYYGTKQVTEVNAGKRNDDTIADISGKSFVNQGGTLGSTSDVGWTSAFPICSISPIINAQQQVESLNPISLQAVFWFDRDNNKLKLMYMLNGTNEFQFDCWCTYTKKN